MVAKLLSEIADGFLDGSRNLGLPSGSPKEDAKLVVVEYLICSSFDLVGEQSRLKVAIGAGASNKDVSFYDQG